MDKQFWLVLSALSCLFAGGFAYAAEEDEKWWVLSVNEQPTICGQTSEGQLLCLHGEALPAAPSSVRKAGTAAPKDWSFIRSGPGPV